MHGLPIAHGRFDQSSTFASYADVNFNRKAMRVLPNSNVFSIVAKCKEDCHGMQSVWRS